eukprot:7492937-Ditylum_brightwellii.AAC.1
MAGLLWDGDVVNPSHSVAANKTNAASDVIRAIVKKPLLHYVERVSFFVRPYRTYNRKRWGGDSKQMPGS